MGLKTTGYKVQNLNLTIPTAYAYMATYAGDMSNIKVTFKIYQDRQDATLPTQPLESKEVSFKVDKELPLWSQAYDIAKNGIFSGWEDDIPVVENEEVMEQYPMDEILEEPMNGGSGM